MYCIYYVIYTCVCVSIHTNNAFTQIRIGLSVWAGAYQRHITVS